MLGQIVAHTPSWVWMLLAGLCFIGFQQTKTRQLSLRRLAILPAVMLGLSLLSLQNSFGFQVSVLALWLVSMVLASWLMSYFSGSAKEHDEADTGLIRVKGSWIPMMLILAMFVTRYVLNAGLAMKPELAQAAGFSFSIAVAFGLINGVFLGRAFSLVFPGAKRARLVIAS